MVTFAISCFFMVIFEVYPLFNAIDLQVLFL